MEGKPFIFDPVRKKYVSLSPEEWVRQHILYYLLEEKKYPKGLIRIESGLDYNSMKKRSDILVLENSGKALILVECKAPGVKINQDTLDQASRYNFHYHAQVLVLSNGIQNLFYRILWDEKRTEPLGEIPAYTR